MLEELLNQILSELHSLNNRLGNLEQGQEALQHGQEQINSRLTMLGNGLEQANSRLTALENGLEHANSRLTALENGLKQANSRMTALENGLEHANSRLAMLEKGMDKIEKITRGIRKELRYGVWEDIKKLDKRLAGQEEEIVMLKRLK